MRRCSVAISDPTRLFREGFRNLMRDAQFEVVASGETLADVFSNPAWPNDLDLIVCRFEPGAGFEAGVAHMRRAKDENLGARFVVLLHPMSRDALHRAVNAGADAVLSVDISPEVLQRSLELVMLGQQLFPALIVEPPTASSDLIPFRRRGVALSAIVSLDREQCQEAPAPVTPERKGDVSLSEREGQILQRLISGAPNKLIARDLDITEATVKVHIKGLLRKVRVNNRTQAAIWGVANGYGPERKQAPVVQVFPRRVS